MSGGACGLLWYHKIEWKSNKKQVENLDFNIKQTYNTFI